MKMNYVYWYHLDTHTDPHTEGYVGITNWPSRRDYQHKFSKGKGSKHLYAAFRKYGDRVSKTLLAETLDREEALLEETYYRPVPEIGWNICAGGGDAPDCTGRVHTKETKQKISESNRRTKKLLPYKPSKFKGVTNRWSAEQKKAIGAAHKGKVISEAHKKAITEKISGANNVKAKEIVMVHKDSPTKVLRFSCIKVAAEVLGLNYQSLRSMYQRANAATESLGPNKSGWVVLYGNDVNDPKTTVNRRIAFQKQRKQDGARLRETRRKQKASK